MRKGYKKISSTIAVVASASLACFGAEEDRIAALEQQMEQMNTELSILKGERQDLAAINEPESKLHFGGYGEIHANFEEGGDSIFDIHRLVFYLGYDLNDWIKLTSETELEHAFVADGGDGELLIEQLYVDFLFNDAINARVGRILAPIGIINQHHEPTKFLGVERPSVDHDIIPTTWSPEGAGIFGYPTAWLSYQAYIVGGLDGSEFDSEEGIRGGRAEARSSLDDPAFTGRIDIYPFINADLPADQELRIGLSGYYGGTDNVDGGGGNGVDNTFGMYSADFDYAISRFQFRGVMAHGFNSDADDLNASFPGSDIADEILGWYLEGGVRILPDSWKTGRLSEADAIPFVRYEWYDTQYEVPSGVTKDGNNERTVVTVGVNVPLTQQFVLKTDYQFRSDDAGDEPNNLFNIGMGWVFQ